MYVVTMVHCTRTENFPLREIETWEKVRCKETSSVSTPRGYERQLWGLHSGRVDSDHEQATKAQLPRFASLIRFLFLYVTAKFRTNSRADEGD